MTVTAQVAETSPHFAVITACPSALAVTLPSASTVATASFDEVHVTVLSVASSGITVAVRVTVCPTLRLKACSLRVIELTGTGSSPNLTSESGVVMLTPSVELSLMFSKRTCLPAAEAPSMPSENRSPSLPVKGVFLSEKITNR